MRAKLNNLEVKWTLVFFILILPLYFKIPGGFQLPLIGWILCIFYSGKSLVNNLGNLFFIVFFSILAVFQYLSSPIINFDAYFRKLAAIYIFIGTYSIFQVYYTRNYAKFMIGGFFIVILYGIFSAPSHFFGYQNLLIPGTCGINNISDIGHLRCSTFGEGNYFGGYLSLMLLIYMRSYKFMIFVLIGVLISWSPTSLIIYLYCIYKLIVHRYCNERILLILIKSIVYLSILVIVLFYYTAVLDLILSSSDRSSLGERAEFIRAGLAMWIDYPLLGVGFGNFGYHLPEYTLFPHLIDRTLYENSRFISNNNITEFLSEQGLFGFIYYVYMINQLRKVRHPILSGYELVVLFLLIGFTMPTFFQIITAALFGVFIATYGHSRNI